LASFWNTSGTNPLVVLTAPSGTIIDVSLELILTDDEAGDATTAVTTASLTTVYYLSLDPNATHRFVPVSLTTTT
jgi:hypothetical protein